MRWLNQFRQVLEKRIYFGKTPKQRGLLWYEYAVVVWSNCDNRNKLIFPDLGPGDHRDGLWENWLIVSLPSLPYPVS